MVQLVDKSSRDGLGIDCLERAVAYSLILLRAKYLGGDFKNNARISYSVSLSTEITAFLVGEFVCPYTQLNFLKLGANWLLSAQEPVSGSIAPSYDPLPPTEGVTEAIPIEPDSVDTLEKYLLWASAEIARLRSLQTPPSIADVSIGFFDEADPPIVRVQFKLPIDYGTFMQTNNLVASMIKICSPSDGSGGGTTLLGNNSIINNSFILGN